MSAAELCPWVRALHVGCAALTIAGFAARGSLMLRESPWLWLKFVRVAPHVVDTRRDAWGLRQGGWDPG